MTLRYILFYILLLYAVSGNAQCICDSLGPELIVNGNFEDAATIISSTSFTGFESDYSGSTTSFSGSTFGIVYWTTNPALVYSSWPCSFTGTGHFLLADGAASDRTNLAVPPYDILRYKGIPVTKGKKYIFQFDWANAGTYPVDTGALLFNDDTTAKYIFDGGSCGKWTTSKVCWNADTDHITIRLNGRYGSYMGRDVCLDNISFRNCASIISDSLSITDSIWCDTVKLSAYTNNSSVASFFWDFGDTFSGSGNLVLHSYGSRGSHSVTLIVTYTSGKKDTLQYMVTTNVAPVKASGDTVICVGSSAQLYATGVKNYNWIPATTLNNDNISDPVATPMLTTVYVVTGTDDNGCISIDSVIVKVESLPVVTANIDSNSTRCQSNRVRLKTTGADKYIWHPGVYCNDSTIYNPIVTVIDSAITFYVKGTSAQGCIDSASVTIYQNKQAEIFIPSGFSPNKDGSNDVLYVRATNISNITFTVYNRWGQKVFETNDLSTGWDGNFNGSPQPIESYAYVAKITTIDKCEITRTGSITLLR